MQITPNSSLLSALSGLSDAQKNKLAAKTPQQQPGEQARKTEETQDARRIRLIEEFREQRDQVRKSKAQNLGAADEPTGEPLNTYNPTLREAPKAHTRPDQPVRPGQIVNILV